MTIVLMLIAITIAIALDINYGELAKRKKRRKP